MKQENRGKAPALHTLVPIEDFKAILGADDREDGLSRFCLTTSTWTIEQFCGRRLVVKRLSEGLEYAGDPLLGLQEYPVREVLAVYVLGGGKAGGELVDPARYRVVPDPAEGLDIPGCLSLAPALYRGRRSLPLRAVYRAGFALGEVPPNLASACLELAGWNMERYRGQRVGMAARGTGKEGEALEPSMPENVRFLLELYWRRTI